MFKKLLLLATVIALSGCAYTPEEAKEITTQTLNIYDDNRTLIKISDPSGTHWMYTNEKDTILALKIHDKFDKINSRYFNVKDIVEITTGKPIHKKGSRDPAGYIKVFMKDGKQFSIYSSASNSDFETYRVYWTLCNKNKDCSIIEKSNLNKVTATSEMDIKYSDLVNIKEKSWPGIYPIKLKDLQFKIHDASEIEQLKKRITEAETTQKQAYEEKMNKIRREIEDKDKRAAEKFELDMRTAEKAGQLSCTSSGYYCQGYPFGDKTALECGLNKIITVGEFKNKGWVVANVNSQFVPKSYDNFCEHYVYQVYLKK